MNETEATYEELIKAFHMTWDEFPGPARLIDSKNMILASNQTAINAGFEPGLVCATVGSPQSHRGCKKFKTLKTEKAQIDRPSPDRIRGWVPLENYPNIVVHFSLTIPAEE